MKLAQIVKLALLQLDEDLEDAVEYDELFKMYANQGYSIAFRDYYKPRIFLTVTSDDEGRIDRCALGEGKIIEIRDEFKRAVNFGLSPDGRCIMVGRGDADYTCFVEDTPYPLKDDDEPRIPEEAHPALVDYICYRHLMNGNMAKQQRGQMYYQEFIRGMRRIVPQGAGSVTHMKNLYAATDIRNGRW